MRTTIGIDALMRETLRATGLKTKREAVEEACAFYYDSANRQRFAGSAANSNGGEVSGR